MNWFDGIFGVACVCVAVVLIATGNVRMGTLFLFGTIGYFYGKLR